MEAVGNMSLNDLLEFSVPKEFPKPTAATARNDRERFIRAKYEDELFKSGVSSSTRQQASSTSSDLDTASAAASPAHQTHGMVEYVGILNIELVAGSDLAVMNIRESSDPYVTFHLGEQSISSKHVDKSVNPVWKERLMLSWDGTSPLVANLFDYNTISADRPMGSLVVDAKTLQSLYSVPELDGSYQVMMPREWAKNFGEHMVAGAEGVSKGVYRGITGVWKDPIKGAKENGFEGFAKGVGIGVAGIVYRPIKGLGTMVKQTVLSVGGKKRRSECEDLVEAGQLHLKLSLQTF